MHEIFVHLLILSHTVTSRENVYHIFQSLGVPKTLKLSPDELQLVVRSAKEGNDLWINII